MRPLLNFLFKHYYFILFLFLEIFAVIIFVNNSYYQQSVIISATNNISGKIYSVISDFSQYISLKTINNQLADENAKLLNLQKNSFIKTDNKVFIVNDTLYRQQYEYVSAQVINNSTNFTDNYLIINKGRKNGIKKDMAVICPLGVVGVVNEVTDNFSSVMSVLHSKAKISAKIYKQKFVGTVVWEGENFETALLKDIPTHVKLKVGDTIVTSGFSLMFPEGINIGTVKKIKIKKGNDFYLIDIKLSTDFNNISFVYVINNLMKPEINKLMINNMHNE